MGNTHSDLKTTPTSLAYKHGHKANRSKRKLNPTAIYRKFSFCHRSVIVTVHSNDKVCDVKRMVEKELKIPYHQQRLFKKGQEQYRKWYGYYHELTDDEEALSEKSDCILVERNVDNVLFVTPDFIALYIIEYSSADTVLDVKWKIEKIDPRIETASHGLLFQGKWLNNEKSLADCNVQKQSTLQLKKLTTIVIKLHNGDPITLEVEADGSETTDLKVCDVKRMIEKKQNIPYHQQQLFMPQHVRWGYLHELTDDEEALSTESECILIQRNIDDVLFITPDSIELCIIAYNSADTVVDVKWKIEETLNLDVVETARQGLIFQGKELSNEKSLADYSIQKQSTLQLRELTTIDICIKQANGDSIFLEVEADGSETIKVCDVKRMVEKKLKVPYHQQQLFQEELENEYGYYDFHELKDDKEVLSTKSGCFLIQSNLDKVLFVILPHFTKPCIIEYNSADTVVDVKWKIERVHHCIEPNHGLVFQGKQLNNEKRLADYNIQKHSTLHLRELTTISIKLLNGDSISLDVKADGNETIKDVKFLIWERLSIPVEEQQLRFKGQKMEDNISLWKFRTSEFLLVPRKCPEMQLFIKSGAGHIISVREYPYNTIADLKSQIQERVRIPSDQQQLTLNGKHLEVELLSECKIQPECTLYLTTRMHDRFQISVTVTVFSNEIDYWFHDRTVTVEVEPTDSIAHVKTKLLDKLMDIPLGEIIELYYKKQKLEDANTVRDYGIRCKSELDLSVYDQTNYSYTTSNGVEIPIVHHTYWDQPRRAVPDSQLFINPVPPCTAFQMPVYVRACKCEPPHAISVGISPTSRVEDIASEIQNALEGIECTKFTLTYALDTGNTLVLSNYGIQRESVLFLEKGDRSTVWPPPISFSKIFHPCRQIEHSHLHGLLQYPVLVQTDEKQRIPIIVEPHTTVADLKTNVERRAAIPVSQQYVIFSGKLLEDEKLLIDYGVHRECILQLLRKFYLTIFVKLSTDKIITILQLNPSTSIKQVKACIQDKEQIPFDHQRLTFAGNVLKDERSLQSYDIDSQCTLYLRLDDTYPINIKTAHGQAISLNVAPTDIISCVKSQIYIREGIIPEQQKLFFGNVTLDDSRMVQSYGIWSMETLMLLKLTDKPAVFIKNITGEVIVLEHCLTKTVAAMKLEVHNERKIPPEKQVMFFRGTRMEGN